MDANLGEFGAVLFLNRNPIYFARKSLKPHQKAYVAINLESLTIAWTIKGIHHFLYGKHFQPETDQKPLQNVPAKYPTQATPRLLCLLMRTLPHDISVIIHQNLNQLTGRLLLGAWIPRRLE